MCGCVSVCEGAVKEKLIRGIFIYVISTCMDNYSIPTQCNQWYMYMYVLRNTPYEVCFPVLHVISK